MYDIFSGNNKRNFDVFINIRIRKPIMIDEKNIRDINHVKEILDNIHDYVKAYEEQIGELSENVLENIEFQLCEIEEFLIGPQKLTASNIANADIRMMKYWKYIEGKCGFNYLMRELKKYEGDV